MESTRTGEHGHRSRTFFQSLKACQSASLLAKADGLTHSPESLRLSSWMRGNHYCTLFLSMSRAPKSDDEQATEANGGQTVMAQSDHLHFSHSNTMVSWNTAFRQLNSLSNIFAQCKVGALQKRTCLTSHRTFSLTCSGFLTPTVICIMHTMRLLVMS